MTNTFTSSSPIDKEENNYPFLVMRILRIYPLTYFFGHNIQHQRCWPGIKPTLPALEVCSLNHLTNGKSQDLSSAQFVYITYSTFWLYLSHCTSLVLIYLIPGSLLVPFDSLHPIPPPPSPHLWKPQILSLSLWVCLFVVFRSIIDQQHCVSSCYKTYWFKISVHHKMITVHLTF